MSVYRQTWKIGGYFAFIGGYFALIRKIGGVFGFGIVNYMKIIHFRVKSFLFSCMAVVGGTLGCSRRVQKANFNHSISQS